MLYVAGEKWNMSSQRMPLCLLPVLVPRYNLQTVKLDMYFGMLDTMSATVFVITEGILYVGMFAYLLNEFRELVSIYDATGSIRGYTHPRQTKCGKSLPAHS